MEEKRVCLMRELAARLGEEKEEDERLSVREVRYAKVILKCLGKRVEGVSVLMEKDKLHILAGKEKEALREVLRFFKTSDNLEHDEAGRVLRDNQLVDLLIALFHIRDGEGERERKNRCEEIVDFPVVHKFGK